MGIEYLRTDEKGLLVVYASSGGPSSFPAIFMTSFVPCFMEAEHRCVYQSATGDVCEMMAEIFKRHPG